MDINTQILAALDEVKRNTLLAAKKVLNVDDVVTLTGMTKAYIYTLTSKREIPFYKPNGRLIFFNRDEIEAWMMRGKVTPDSETEEAAALAGYMAK